MRPAAIREWQSDVRTYTTIVALAIVGGGCVDSSNIARTDQPAPLLAVEDSLDREHFRGLVVVEALGDGTLQLRFRDPGGCGRDSIPLRSFAEQAAARAASLFRPQQMPTPTTVERVRVKIRRTHRFGVLVWTTKLGDFSFPVSSLRNVVVPPSGNCGTLSPLLKKNG